MGTRSRELLLLLASRKLVGKRWLHQPSVEAVGKVVRIHRSLVKRFRTATAEARVCEADGNLVAMGTGGFENFEKQGNPIA
ncbi:MAG: hypothetical protein AVDCRST_MAG28-1028 [uncultured Rubrobacteraceae bacterium]|uniref:Uncharacterized protein n=1 Tax=uncultured Rubrobacteraceae bacterium TaxID=349277 RepID=A0A6J4QKZ1_9ACTN|nr:MAG: hypothetical protein AVDCRST_MAG28-1028 [uncultured Rubrobacteraceae bacterium]